MSRPVQLLSHALREARDVTEDDEILEHALSSLTIYRPYPSTFLPRVKKLKFSGWEGVEYRPVLWSQLPSLFARNGNTLTLPDNLVILNDGHFNPLSNILSGIPNCSLVFGTTRFGNEWIDGKIDYVNLSVMLFFPFKNCNTLKTLDLFKLDTSVISRMEQMFQGCSSLTAVDTSNFNTSKVTTMRNMFDGCSSLPTIDLSSFNTSNTTDMTEMFQGCMSLMSLDLSSFDTSQVTDFSGMFRNCKALPKLDLSNFNTSNVTMMDRMFEGCSTLTSLDLSSFDISKVTTMRYMFSNCSNLTTLNLAGWKTASGYDLHYSLDNCNNLTTIICPYDMMQSFISHGQITDSDNVLSASIMVDHTMTKSLTWTIENFNLKSVA